MTARGRFAGRALLIASLALGIPTLTLAQDGAPALRAGIGADTIRLDGILNEPAWSAAAMGDAFAQTDPSEGAPATFRTTVRVLAGRDVVVIGIVCDDAEPDGIVSFNVRRDAPLQQEDRLSQRPVGHEAVVQARRT